MSVAKSGRGKPSFVQFYPSDWLAGTARMTRLVHSVYFEVCLYNWDKNLPIPEAEMMLMLADIAPQGDDIIEALVAAGKLKRDERGVYSERALRESQRAWDVYAAKSRGGKVARGGEGEQEESSGTPAAEVSQNQNQNQNQRKKGESDDSLVGDGEPPPPPVPKRTFNSQSVVDAWNGMAVKAGLTQVKKLTEERRKRLRARLEEHGETTLIAAIERVPESAFLMGAGERGWKATFDFMLRPENCAKLIEGAYHNKGEGRASAWRGEG